MQLCQVCNSPAADDDLIVIEVWDSIEDYQAFDATLRPILANEQIEMAPAAPLKIHRLIDGSDSSALRRNARASWARECESKYRT